jgi:hypothetical protein
MNTWTWSDPRWRDRVGDNAEATVREALRRAVDLRDTLAESENSDAGRAVFLVDVLNQLARLQGFDTSGLWERTDRGAMAGGYRSSWTSTSSPSTKLEQQPLHDAPQLVEVRRHVGERRVTGQRGHGAGVQ